MRLIDADAFLRDSIKQKRFVIYKEDALNNVYVVNTVYDDLAKALNNAPTIDAIEVVRCRDCAYKNKPDFCPAQIQGFGVTPDWYCPMGVKMDAE